MAAVWTWPPVVSDPSTLVFLGERIAPINQQTLDGPPLLGNDADGYLIQVDVGTNASQGIYTWRPNGAAVTTAGRTQGVFGNGAGAPGSFFIDDQLSLGNFGGAPVDSVFGATIELIGVKQGHFRRFMTQYCHHKDEGNLTALTYIAYTAVWADKVALLSSLQIHCNVATGIAANSSIRVWARMRG